MKRYCLLTLLLFGLISPSFAQDTLSINPSNSAVTPDTFFFGDTVRYQLLLKNWGPNAISGNVYFLVKANNKTPFALGFVNVGNLNPGSDTLVYFTDTSSIAKYDGGVNILIVWPDKPNCVQKDTFHEYTYGKYPVALDPGKELVEWITLYPNPSQGKVLFRSEMPVRPESYILVDAKGAVIREEQSLPDELDLSLLPAGLYFFEFRFGGGKVQRSKIIME